MPPRSAREEHLKAQAEKIVAAETLKKVAASPSNVKYGNQATAQVLSVVVSEFVTAAGATSDFADDLAGKQGRTVPSPTIGEQSAVTIQDMPGSVASQLVLVRFRRGVHTWSLAYQASPTAEPSVAIALATALLTRTST